MDTVNHVVAKNEGLMDGLNEVLENAEAMDLIGDGDPNVAKESTKFKTTTGLELDHAKKYRISIEEQDGQPNFEKVSVNGVAYQIKRGTVVTVPAGVVEVLEHAIASKLVPEIRPEDGRQIYVEKDYHAIPYRFLGEATNK